MNSNDVSGKHFVAYWTSAADKGLMNANTAKSIRAACAQVLGVLENWESVDVSQLDLDDLFRRFQNKRGKDFVPESLETYKRRFAAARTAFLSYAADPSSWKSPFRPRSTRVVSSEKPPANEAPVGQPQRSVTRPSENTLVQNDLIDYPFPLRPEQIVHLRLPADLNNAETRRLGAFIETLAIDPDPSK